MSSLLPSVASRRILVVSAASGESAAAALRERIAAESTRTQNGACFRYLE
jgi:hypothetical protein